MSATIISAPPARSEFLDRELHAGNGYVMLAIGFALIAFACWLAFTGLRQLGAVEALLWRRRGRCCRIRI